MVNVYKKEKKTTLVLGLREIIRKNIKLFDGGFGAGVTTGNFRYPNNLRKSQTKSSNKVTSI